MPELALKAKKSVTIERKIMTAANKKRTHVVSERYDSAFNNTTENKLVSTQRTNSPSLFSKAVGRGVTRSFVSKKKDKNFSYMQIYTAANDTLVKPKAYHSTTSSRNRDLPHNPVFLSFCNKPSLSNNQPFPIKSLF